MLVSGNCTSYDFIWHSFLAGKSVVPPPASTKSPPFQFHREKPAEHWKQKWGIWDKLDLPPSMPVITRIPGWHDIFQGSIPIPKPSFPTIASWEGAITQAIISLYGDLSVFLQFLRWRLPKYEMQPLYKRQRLLQSRPCQTNKRHLEIRCWRSSRNFPTATWFHKPTLVPWDWKTSWKCKMYIN